MVEVAALTWDKLQEHLMSYTEEDCFRLIEEELQLPQPRHQLVFRLYGRGAKLRAEREREELLERLIAARKGKPKTHANIAANQFKVKK